MAFEGHGVRVSALCLLALAYCQPALADTFSQAQVVIAQPFPQPQLAGSTLGSDVVTVSGGGVNLSAQSVVATGSVGLQVLLPPGGYDNSLRASAYWTDNWTSSSTSPSPTVPIGADITLDGSIDTDYFDAWVGGTIWASAFSLVFRYDVGGHTFTVGMGADDTPAAIGAFFDGTDITADLIFTPDAVDSTKTHFAISYATPVINVAAGGFIDTLSVTYESDGRPPAIDAIHTFRAQLGTPDSSVVFGSDSGRAFGLTTIPEPSTALEIGLALALLASSTRAPLT